MKWIVPLLLIIALPAYAQRPADSIAGRPCRDTLPCREVEMPHCGRTLLVHGQLVVTTAAELHDRFVLYNAVCDTNAIPTFDFEKYTLIGCWVTLGNCGAGHIFNITVCRDDSAHCYRHILERRENPCRGISSYMSWLLVPRLPAGYRVVFE